MALVQVDIIGAKAFQTALQPFTKGFYRAIAEVPGFRILITAEFGGNDHFGAVKLL